MKKIYALLLLSITAMLSSCSAIVLGISKDRSLKGAIRVTDTIRNRQVIFLNMTHLGTPEHYAELRRYLDDRKAEGFVTYCEGIARWDSDIDGPFDSLKYDTLKRKIRRALGFSMGQYDDKDNKSLPAYLRNSGLVMQDYDSLGLTSEKDYWVDLTYRQVVRYYERRNDTIPLTPYDFATPFNAQYTAPDNGFVNLYDFTDAARELYLTDVILIKKRPKIIVVYGGGHSQNFANKLKRSGYEKFEYAFLEKEAKAAAKIAKKSHKQPEK